MVVAEWVAFAEMASANDDAQAHCLTHPLHIPLNDLLFGNAVNDGARAVNAISPRVRDRVVGADSVTFRRRGRQAAATTPYIGDQAPAATGANIIAANHAGITVPRAVGALLPVLWQEIAVMTLSLIKILIVMMIMCYYYNNYYYLIMLMYYHSRPLMNLHAK